MNGKRKATSPPEEPPEGPVKQRRVRFTKDLPHMVDMRRMRGAIDEDQIANHLEKYLMAADNETKCTVSKNLYTSPSNAVSSPNS